MPVIRRTAAPKNPGFLSALQGRGSLGGLNFRNPAVQYNVRTALESQSGSQAKWRETLIDVAPVQRGTVAMVEAVRQALSKIPGTLTADIRAERDER